MKLFKGKRETNKRLLVLEKEQWIIKHPPKFNNVSVVQCGQEMLDGAIPSLLACSPTIDIHHGCSGRVYYEWEYSVIRTVKGKKTVFLTMEDDLVSLSEYKEYLKGFQKEK